MLRLGWPLCLPSPSILDTTSIPEITFPKTTCRPSNLLKHYETCEPRFHKNKEPRLASTFHIAKAWNKLARIGEVESPASFYCRDEELRSICIWSSICHWQNPCQRTEEDSSINWTGSPFGEEDKVISFTWACVLQFEVLVRKSVSIYWLSPSSIPTSEVAPLDHKAGNNPMEFATLIVEKLSTLPSPPFSCNETTN